MKYRRLTALLIDVVKRVKKPKKLVLYEMKAGTEIIFSMLQG